MLGCLLCTLSQPHPACSSSAALSNYSRLLPLLSQAWSYPGGQTPEKRGARARRLAVWIRESILQLGPTFITLGQVG